MRVWNTLGCFKAVPQSFLSRAACTKRGRVKTRPLPRSLVNRVRNIEIADFFYCRFHKILYDFTREESYIRSVCYVKKTCTFLFFNLTNLANYFSMRRSQRLRSKKISNMIHNSDTHPNVQSCTVSVHFQARVFCSSRKKGRFSAQEISDGLWPVFRIRIHLIWNWIQHFRVNTDP